MIIRTIFLMWANPNPCLYLMYLIGRCSREEFGEREDESEELRGLTRAVLKMLEGKRQTSRSMESIRGKVLEKEIARKSCLYGSTAVLQPVL